MMLKYTWDYASDYMLLNYEDFTMTVIKEPTSWSLKKSFQIGYKYSSYLRVEDLKSNANVGGYSIHQEPLDILKELINV